ncbi:MAG TPA: hypothetical protein PK177_04085 [Burkholderiaceae bacterium]|nr:hypothetical protein [Burkholderiaceae bacterium]
MRLILSFDVEVWCNGWGRLDDEFPRAFERYVYGHSRTEGGALPRTLEVLRRHGVRAVFFVEPLFAARFGLRYLREIVDLIGSSGQQIELHLHSEWADEIRPRPLPHIAEKRQHLQQLPFDDQLTLIRTGLELMRQAGVSGIGAFRAGSFGANGDTLRAVAAAGLSIDSSINAAADISVPDLRGSVDMYQPSRIGDVLSLPLTVFRDGFGRTRPAQVGSCSFSELRQVLDTAIDESWPAVTMLSHNFEMLRPDSVRIDPIVLDRFERLCAYVASRRELATPQGNLFDSIAPPEEPIALPRANFAGTARRFGEQLLRRALPA